MMDAMNPSIPKEDVLRLLARWRLMSKILRDSAKVLSNEPYIHSVWSKITDQECRADTYERVISELELAALGSEIPEPGAQWVQAEVCKNYPLAP